VWLGEQSGVAGRTERGRTAAAPRPGSSVPRLRGRVEAAGLADGRPARGRRLHPLAGQRLPPPAHTRDTVRSPAWSSAMPQLAGSDWCRCCQCSTGSVAWVGCDRVLIRPPPPPARAPGRSDDDGGGGGGDGGVSVEGSRSCPICAATSTGSRWGGRISAARVGNRHWRGIRRRTAVRQETWKNSAARDGGHPSSTTRRANRSRWRGVNAALAWDTKASLVQSGF